MNTTIDLDSSNEAENLNPNVASVEPKKEIKGKGEKLGDTIELSSSEEDSEISITEEKKPILKRSKDAFNSTKNDTLNNDVTSKRDGDFNFETPYSTPQSSVPPTAYKSMITSTPAEPPLPPSNEESTDNETSENCALNLSAKLDSEDDECKHQDESSSSTEGADIQQDLSESEHDGPDTDNEVANSTYENSETVRIDPEESLPVDDKLHESKFQTSEEGGILDDTRTAQIINVEETSTSLNKEAINTSLPADASLNLECSRDVGLVEDELYNSMPLNNEESLIREQSDLNQHASEEIPSASNSNNNVPKDETLSSENEIKISDVSPGMAETSSSGEESDIEDEDTTKEDIDPSNLTLPSKKRRTEEIQNLPETCTLLRAKNGGRVYIVGTAHFSHESQVDVATVIQAVQPDVVVLELCKDRTNILHLDEETVLEEAKNLTMDKMLLAIRQNGTVQGVMYLLLLSMSAHLTKELGMAPGGEFRQAFREARTIPGCLVHLGDRPINITLKRALGSLSLWQKLKLGFNILTSKDSITKEDVEKCKQKDLLESMLEEMAGEFPALSRVFVHERDMYLAHSLKLAADRPFGHPYSPQKSPTDDSTVEAPVVVGVVGIGHVPGIVQNWETVCPEDVAKVVLIPPMSTAGRMTRLVIRVSFASIAMYSGYRLFRGPISRVISVLNRTLNYH